MPCLLFLLWYLFCPILSQCAWTSDWDKGANAKNLPIILLNSVLGLRELQWTLFLRFSPLKGEGGLSGVIIAFTNPQIPLAAYVPGKINSSPSKSELILSSLSFVTSGHHSLTLFLWVQEW